MALKRKVLPDKASEGEKCPAKKCKGVLKLNPC
jgi:hypothetical protein